MNFSANVDGPWLVRTWDDFVVELDQLTEHLAALKAVGSSTDVVELPAAEFVLGVRAAANWTLGVWSQAPATQRPLTVSDEAVVEQAQIARGLALGDDAALRLYGAGAFAWLRWLTGMETSIAYPAP
jgi:hypothetical protein